MAIGRDMDGRPIRPKGIQQSAIPAYEGFGSELDDDFLDTLDAQGRVTTIDENDNPIIAPPQQAPFQSALPLKVTQTPLPNVGFNPPPAPQRPTPPPVPISRVQNEDPESSNFDLGSGISPLVPEGDSSPFPGPKQNTPTPTEPWDGSDEGLLDAIKRFLQRQTTIPEWKRQQEEEKQRKLGL